MSKNQGRYKEDYTHTDIEELEDMTTESFEKFRPKKKTASNKKDKKIVDNKKDE